MRDLPPISQLGDHQQMPDHQTSVDRVSDRTMTVLNGRLPSPSRTSSLPRHFPGQSAGSPTVPPRPLMQLVSQASVERPSSPTSRPQSPWCRFDPYDSPEVSSCKGCTQLPVNRSTKIKKRKNISNYFWLSDIPTGPGQRICGFCHPAEPSSQKDGEERVHVYTHGGR